MTMSAEERAAKMARIKELEAFIAQAEAEAAAQQNIQQQPVNMESTHTQIKSPALPEAMPADPNTPWYDDIKRGVGLSAAETALGVKGLVSGLDPTEEQALKLWRDDVKGSGGFGTAGSVLGEVAQVAVPVSKINTLAKASALPRSMAGTAAVLGDAGVMAALGGMQAPTETRSRGDAAVENALFALAGGTAGSALNKTLTGLKRSPSGDELLRRGVPLTPAQASENGVIKALEFGMSLTPALAKSVQKQKESALRGFNKLAAQEAAPEGVKISAGGHKGMQEVKQAYKQKYTDAWEKSTPFTDEQLIGFMDTTKAMREALGDNARYSAGKIDDALERVGQLRSVEAMENLDGVLRTQIDRAESGSAPDLDLADWMNDLRGQIQQSASPETAAELAKLNAKYGGYKVAKKATAMTGAMKRGGSEKGIFSTDELTQAVRSVGGETRAATNAAPLQHLSNLGTDTIGDKVPVPLLDSWRQVARKLPSPNFALEPAARAMLGETAVQKKTKALADFLRSYGISGAAMGGAIGSNTGE